MRSQDCVLRRKAERPADISRSLRLLRAARMLIDEASHASQQLWVERKGGITVGCQRGRQGNADEQGSHMLGYNIGFIEYRLSHPLIFHKKLS
jgi:hypothetical protein